MDLDRFQNDFGVWWRRALGAPPLPATLAKLKTEVQELERAIDSGDAIRIAEESADVMLALCGLAEGARFSLATEVLRKHLINERRRWARQPDGSFQHVEAPA